MRTSSRPLVVHFILRGHSNQATLQVLSPLSDVSRISGKVFITRCGFDRGNGGSEEPCNLPEKRFRRLIRLAQSEQYVSRQLAQTLSSALRVDVWIPFEDIDSGIKFPQPQLQNWIYRESGSP